MHRRWTGHLPEWDLGGWQEAGALHREDATPQRHGQGVAEGDVGCDGFPLHCFSRNLEEEQKFRCEGASSCGPGPTRSNRDLCSHLYQQFRCAQRDVGHRHDGTAAGGLQEGLHPDQVMLRGTVGVVVIAKAQNLLVGWTNHQNQTVNA